MPQHPLLKLKVINVAFDGFSLLAEHETNTLEGHFKAIRTRLAVARKARSLGELLRDQIDLVPDTQARFKRDHQLRRQLIKGLGQDLRRA